MHFYPTVFTPRTRRTAFWLLLSLGFISTACHSSRTKQEAAVLPTTIVLVRHAEKAFGTDPDLTEAGHDRAQRLAEMLAGTELAAIYSSDYKRTRQTAKPVADRMELPVKIYDHHYLLTFAGQLRRRHPGETVLVVGHSNTTPELVGMLDRNRDYPRIPETDYSYLYVVTLPPTEPAKVLELHF